MFPLRDLDNDKVTIDIDMCKGEALSVLYVPQRRAEGHRALLGCA